MRIQPCWRIPPVRAASSIDPRVAAEALAEPLTLMPETVEAPLLLPKGPPVVTDLGHLVSLGSRHLVRWDGQQVTAFELPSSQTASWYDPVWDSDGTCHYIPAHRRELLANRDGELLHRFRAPEQLTAPPASDGQGGVWVATREGQIFHLDHDYQVQHQFRCQLGPDPNRNYPTFCVATPTGVVIQTFDRRLVGLDFEGEPLWERELDFLGQRPPQLSKDGQRLHLSSWREGYLALDVESGKTVLEHKLDLSQGGYLVAPVLEHEDDLLLYTQNGTVLRLDSSGLVSQTFQSGVRFTRFQSSVGRLGVDAAGNVAVLAGPGDFKLFSPEGKELAHLRASQLFGSGEYFHDFSMAPDGDRLFLLPGSGGVAEIKTPESASERARRYREAEPEEPERPRFEIGPDQVTIGTFSLEIRD